MLGFLEKFFGKHMRARGPEAGIAPEPPRRPNPQGIGTRRSLARMNAEKLAFGKEAGKYRLFEPRPGAGMSRLLGCGPTLNVDGTPMVGDSGYDELGKPYGVVETCRVTEDVD